jgi:hypothetical protein
VKKQNKTKQDVQESKEYMHALTEIVEVSQIIKSKEEETFRFTFPRVLPINILKYSEAISTSLVLL